MQKPIPSADATTRRAFLTARPASHRGHIVSIVVQAWPERLPEIEPLLNAIPGVETHAAQAGKLIVTVEAESDAHLIELIGAIEAADGVITASLVYHQLEETDHG